MRNSKDSSSAPSRRTFMAGLGSAASVAPLLGQQEQAKDQPESAANARSGSLHVWEKIELVFTASNKYRNPYTDAEMWVDLKGPNFSKRCYGFWDGGRTFRVRVLATEPGLWTWTSGSSPADSGLAGKSGSFRSTSWTEAEKRENPNRRGFPQATPNGHALQYADGTPYFIVGDFFYPASTTRYIWRDSPKHYAVESPRAGFKDMVDYRKKQQFNMLYIISCFPNWAYDGWPARFSDEAGVVIRDAWPNGNENRAERMVNEVNEKPFLFPGKASGYPEVGADLWRINPSYFQYIDKKIEYAGANGFQVYLETLRRDLGPYAKAYYGATSSDMSKNAVFYYLRWICARYQADPVMIGIIHQDVSPRAHPRKGFPGLASEEWLPVLDGYYKRYGHPPFGQLVSANASGSTYRMWGDPKNIPWLTMNQAGNFPRDNRSCEEILEMYQLPHPLPCYNQEPWYVASDTPNERARNRATMYGCLLSGGLAGVAYEAYGLTRGNRECSERFPNMWESITWKSAGEVHLAKEFMMTHGTKYQDLVPHRDLLSVSKTGDWPTEGWAFLMRTDDKKLFKLYFQKRAAHSDLSGALANSQYKAQWFDPRSGSWSDAGSGTLSSDSSGRIALPQHPTGSSEDDWALSLSAM